MTGAPWHVKGVRPEARETARQAARRSGLSVGRWLNSVILDSADRLDDEMSPAPYDHRRDPPTLGIAAINARFDELTRQLDRFMRHDGRDRWDPPRANPPGEATGQRIAEAISRLEGKLDQMIGDRLSVADLDRRGDIDRALANLNHERLRGSYAGGAGGGLEQAVAEISARQRALDVELPDAGRGAVSRDGPVPAAPGPDFSKLEQCLREVTARLEALQTPCRAGDLAEALRQELADMRRTVAEAMPRGAIEAIENQVRALGARLDAQRENGIDAAALTGFERALADIREALQGLAPIESLAGLDEALDRLTQKMDLVSERNQSPDSLRQLEASVEGLRGVVAHVASADALSTLAGEIRSLGEKIDRSQRSDPGLIDRLEARIAAIGDAIEARRLEGGEAERAVVDDLVRAIAGKLDGLQLTRADQSALMHLEERMTQLAAKLDASEIRLGHLDAIERGVAELLVHLDQLRPRIPEGVAGPAGIADIAAIEALTRDIAALRENRSDTDRRTQDLLDAMHGTIGQVADRLATIEADLRNPVRMEAPPPAARSFTAAALPAGPPSGPSGGAQASPLARPAAPPERLKAPPAVEPAGVKIDRALPPNTPLEPGTGAPRGGAAASAVERIAASEAAAASTKPEQGSARSNFIIAARRAAQAAAGEQQSKGRAPAAPAADQESKPPTKLVARVKSLIVGASIVLIVAGTAFGVRGYLGLPSAPGDAKPLKQVAEARPTPDRAPANKEMPPAPPVRSEAPTAATNAVAEAGRGKDKSPEPGQSVPAATAAKADERLSAARSETDPSPTGALPQPRDAAMSSSQISTAPAPSPPITPAPDQLPPTIGGRTLLAAVAAGDPAAAYEVGARYAEGRGVSQDPAAAAAWFARAAAAGLAPAQFRLGSMYEKGVGVAKDLAEAHRLYVAAAAKGNAKAMHNLAVLNAEGFQGKPDYATAAQWFQKAAGYGVADSQYNLGILYARGIGVEQNLAESYKWFALAARSGDPESAKKRDDVGGRLDQQSLVAARLAAQTFVAETQPEEAITVNAPPGGWDEVAAPAKPKSRVRPRAG
jgi:localization factor PodJL